MKPESKVFSIVLGYCVVLWLTNWSLSHEYQRKIGLTSCSIDLRLLGALFGIVASVVLTRRICEVVRILLNAGIRIPTSVRLWGSWSTLWLLSPLILGLTHHGFHVTSDGVDVRTVFIYGGGPSLASIAFSGIAIMLFQLLVRLEAFNPNNKAEQTGSGS